MEETCSIDIPTHPAKGKTKNATLPNFFSKIFFKIWKPIVYVAVETPPSDNPTHDLEGWGSPPNQKYNN
jgi:hypothetical protein